MRGQEPIPWTRPYAGRMSRLPSPPPDAGPAGKRLWRAVCADYELSGADLELLRVAVLEADQIEALRKVLAMVSPRTGEPFGPIVVSKDGTAREHPAAVALRHHALVLARILAAVRVVGDGAEDEHDRPQRRVGVKGV